MSQGLVYINDDMNKALEKLSGASRLAVQAIDVEKDEGMADAVLTVINGVIKQWKDKQ